MTSDLNLAVEAYKNKCNEIKNLKTLGFKGLNYFVSASLNKVMSYVYMKGLNDHVLIFQELALNGEIIINNQIKKIDKELTKDKPKILKIYRGISKMDEIYKDLKKRLLIFNINHAFNLDSNTSKEILNYVKLLEPHKKESVIYTDEYDKKLKCVFTVKFNINEDYSALLTNIIVQYDNGDYIDYDLITHITPGLFINMLENTGKDDFKLNDKITVPINNLESVIKKGVVYHGILF